MRALETDWELEASNKTGYIETYTGKLFTPMDPQVADVCLEDMAHALAMKCRYTGHTRNFYSVAEHSVLMAEWFEGQGAPWRALFALLHDTPEAYLPDVPRPVKLQWDWWPEIEGRVHGTIMAFFRYYDDLDRAIAADVKRADSRILLTEAAALLTSQGEAWGDWRHDYTPLPVAIRCWTPARAKQAWLEAYDRLKHEWMP